MSICSILETKLDSRKGGTDCEFNGYLEDYLSLAGSELDPVLLEGMRAIQESEPDTKVCAGLRCEISRDAISNQIIRYKDVFKLSGKPLTVPYILYLSKDGEDRALMLVENTGFGFFQAKGLYYCMTEPGSEFIECKNEIVALPAADADQICNTFGSLFKQRAGVLQRNIDSRYFKNYDEMKAAAIAYADTLRDSVPAELEGLEDRSERIRSFVVEWFLLKKVLYVQYMVNKNILNSVHEGNVRKQRNQAKNNADEITFMSFSEMWRSGNAVAEETPEPAEE